MVSTDCSSNISTTDEAKLTSASAGSTESLSVFLKLLLKKCATEKDDELRNMLAICLGEIGGVDPSFVGTDDMFEEANDPSKAWLLSRGVPWKSKSVRYYYQLQLITTHFVAALRAAPTPTDQHKIAFAIQECKKQYFYFMFHNITFAHISSSPKY